MFRTALLVTGAAVVLALGAPISAFDSNHTTRLTFNTPIGLPGVSLPAGTYVFEVVDNMSTLDIVRVSSRDRRHSYLITITRPVLRPAGVKDDRQIVFAEVKPGNPLRIAAWYPIGDRQGREFIY